MSPRVLHVAQPTTGGVAHYLVPLVQDQLHRGWEPVVAGPLDGIVAAEMRAAGVRHLPWPARRNPGPSVPAEVARLARIIRGVEPDLVHLHSSKAGLAGRLPSGRRRPTLFQPHGWSWLAVTGPAAVASLRWERLAARRCDRLVCVSQGERTLGIDAGLRAPWAVVPTGVDLARFRPLDTAQRTAVRHRLGIGSEPLAVCVGRLSEAKGQDLLAGCWPGVRTAVPDAVLALVGDGEMRARVEAMAGPGVRLLGQRDDAADWYAAADVVVVPSRWDALSLSLVEAAASGCCIVATDAPGAREVLGDDAAGIVPLGDGTRLAEAIAQRLVDDELAATEGRANRARAEQRFDRQEMFERLAALTTDVLAERVAR